MDGQSTFNQQCNEPQEYSFRVGNITAQGVTLVDKEYNIIQLPYSILPRGSKSGSIIKLTIVRDIESEIKEEQCLNSLIEKLESGNNENIVSEETQIRMSSQSSILTKKQESIEANDGYQQKESKKILKPTEVEMKKKPVSAQNISPQKNMQGKQFLKNKSKPSVSRSSSNTKQKSVGK